MRLSSIFCSYVTVANRADTHLIVETANIRRGNCLRAVYSHMGQQKGEKQGRAVFGTAGVKILGTRAEQCSAQQGLMSLAHGQSSVLHSRVARHSATKQSTG